MLRNSIEVPLPEPAQATAIRLTDAFAAFVADRHAGSDFGLSLQDHYSAIAIPQSYNGMLDVSE